MKKLIILLLFLPFLSKAQTFIQALPMNAKFTVILFQIDSLNQTKLNNTWQRTIDTAGWYEIGVGLNIQQIDPTVKGTFSISVLSGGVITPLWIMPTPFKPMSNLSSDLRYLNKADIIQVKMACVGLSMTYRWYLQGRLDE